ncbi:MAG: M23 family metallopeptidase [Peptococcaceae bacterium]|jgi:hypothetical protein|nr:M23 family metallopeptidase [Peptococcaceae bacterium]
MGQLKDFTMSAAAEHGREPFSRRGRRSQRPQSLRMSLWLKQVVWCCMIFAAVSGIVKMDNDWSRNVQQLLFNHLNMETDLLPVLQPLYFQGEQPPVENNGVVANGDADQKDNLSLLVPISGIVLKNFTPTDDGNMVVDSITIKTPEGGKLINACAGQVATIVGDVGNWQVTVTCENGWKMVYSGLKDLSVTAGQQIAAGTVLGNAVEGEVKFALYQGDVPVDPMAYFLVNQ